MKKYLIFLLLTSCHSQVIVEKPKLLPTVVVNPYFEGYALVLKIKWDVIKK